MRCLCGYIISDQTDDLPYKAEFFADEDYAGSYGGIIRFITEFIQTEQQGERNAFLAKYFGEKYPQNVAVSSIVSDILASIRVAFGHTVYECENCGRLWIQLIPEKDSYVSYIPEAEARGVLRSQKSVAS